LSLLGELHNQRGNVSPVEIKKESPRHRIILLMKAQGMSNRAIASELGITPEGVGLVTRQPWFRAALVQLLNHSGVDEVKGLIAGAAADAVYKIIELAQTAKSEQVQKDCCFDIVDRFLGKAPVVDGGKKAPIADEKKLDAEIAELERRLRVPAPRTDTPAHGAN